MAKNQYGVKPDIFKYATMGAELLEMVIQHTSKS